MKHISLLSMRSLLPYTTRCSLRHSPSLYKTNETFSCLPGLYSTEENSYYGHEVKEVYSKNKARGGNLLVLHLLLWSIK